MAATRGIATLDEAATLDAAAEDAWTHIGDELLAMPEPPSPVRAPDPEPAWLAQAAAVLDAASTTQKQTLDALVEPEALSTLPRRRAPEIGSEHSSEYGHMVARPEEDQPPAKRRRWIEWGAFACVLLLALLLAGLTVRSPPDSHSSYRSGRLARLADEAAQARKHAAELPRGEV